MHQYVVRFDEQGKFLGGVTDDHEGGTPGHTINKGTITNEMNGHAHRFSFLNDIEIVGAV